MEYRRVATLFVLALLQLCRADHILPRWNAAYLDNFQPNPPAISELYFSTSKPIVVTDKIYNSVSNEVEFISSQVPSTMPTRSTDSIPETYVPITTEMPDRTFYDQFTTYLDSSSKQETNMPNQVLPLKSEAPPQTTRYVPPPTEPEPLFTPGPPLTDLFQLHTTTQMKPTSGSTQQTVLVTKPPPSSFPAAFKPPNSNYFLIYQQAPQINPFPPSSPSGPGISEVTIRELTPTTVPLPARTSEAFSTIFPTSISTTPLPTNWLSTNAASTDLTSTLSSSGVTVTPSSTFGLSTGFTSTTPLPPQRVLNRVPSLTFPLKIRVIAPRGSITNVNINPPATTKRPVVTKTTTTRRPTTRRTPKPKKNTYDRCLDGCKKVQDPICAAPLSHLTIDPKTLKRFPSVCHMACHNSYRNAPFEKVIDGSCGKLRSRIRLIDSKTNLKKNELRKNEYSIDQGLKTIIELTGVQ